MITKRRHHWPHNFILPFHPHGGRGLIVARGIHGGPPGLLGPILTLVLGFVILVGGAIIVARWIVRGRSSGCRGRRAHARRRRR